MKSVYLIGGHATSFGKRPKDTYKDLTRETVLGTLADAGLQAGVDIGFIWFGNVAMYRDGQSSIKGQVCLAPLIRESILPEFVPIANVENACATTSTALHAAVQYVRAGQSDLAMVVGVEKLFSEEAAGVPFNVFNGGIDQQDPDEWLTYYKEAGAEAGKPFEAGDDRSIFMDTYAMQAAYHMRAYGTTQYQISMAAAKAHNFGADNPRAQYRFRMTPDEVMADRPVSFPLTRSMCAPIGDGASGLLICSEQYLEKAPSNVQSRAIRLRACTIASGRYRGLSEASVSSIAGAAAYAEAGVRPDEIDVAEVHDATSFSEIFQSEALGFCPKGAGGAFIEQGGGSLDSSVAINTSGGLVSKGHPVAATGASMIYELMEQLRGEAGPRQKQGARFGLAENGGGVVGFDEATCVVSILERL